MDFKLSCFDSSAVTSLFYILSKIMKYFKNITLKNLEPTKKNLSTDIAFKKSVLFAEFFC